MMKGAGINKRLPPPVEPPVSETASIEATPQPVWFAHAPVVEHWVDRGVAALQRLDILVDHGLGPGRGGSASGSSNSSSSSRSSESAPSASGSPPWTGITGSG